MTSPATARIGVEASPTGRHARGATAAEHVQISMSALWTPALRLSLELVYRTSTPANTALAPALIQTGLNVFSRRREAHLRGTP